MFSFGKQKVRNQAISKAQCVKRDLVTDREKDGPLMIFFGIKRLDFLKNRVTRHSNNSALFFRPVLIPP